MQCIEYLKKCFAGLNLPVYIFLLITFLSPGFLNAQWKKTLGPAGGYAVALYAKGDTLFAGNFEHFTLASAIANAGTLYRSLDKGAHWYRDSTGFQGVPNSFTHNGSSVFVSTQTDGIFRSLDNGSTWKSLPNTNLFNPTHLLTVNGIMYVGGSPFKGMQKSTNNGNSFQTINSGLPASPSIGAIGAVGNTIFISVVDEFGHSAGVFKSTNQGANWVPANGNLGTPFAQSFATNGNKLFAVFNTSELSVWASTDLGKTWQPSNAGITGAGYQIFSLGDTLYTTAFVPGAWNVYRSINNGASWSYAGNGIPTSEEPIAFAAIGKDIYAALEVYGSVYKNPNAGINWSAANIGLANVDTRTIFQSGNKLFAGSLSNASVHVSADGGNTWKPSGNGMPSTYRIVKTFTQNSNYLFAGMDYFGVYRSSDNGKNWEAAANGLGAFGLYVNSLTIKGNFVFAATYNDVYKSSNNGTTWTKTTPVFGSSREVKTIVAKGNYLFAGVESYYGVFRSADNGSSWQEVNTGFPTLIGIHQLIVRGNDLIAATGAGIYISTDNGDHWTQKVNGFAGNYNTRTVAAKGDTLVTAIYDQNYFLADGIYVSTNNGNSWQRFDKNIKPFAVNYVTIAGNNIYAATETESVWKAALSAIKIESINSANNTSAVSTVDEKRINKNILLSPNPASNYIVVKYSSDVISPAEIIVVNMQGKMLMRMPVTINAGENNFNVDVNTFAPGSYLLQLKTANNMLTEKFIKQ